LKQLARDKFYNQTLPDIVQDTRTALEESGKEVTFHRLTHRDMRDGVRSGRLYRLGSSIAASNQQEGSTSVPAAVPGRRRDCPAVEQRKLDENGIPEDVDGYRSDLERELYEVDNEGEGDARSPSGRGPSGAAISHQSTW
jgi:hypothetical protein